MVGHALRGGKRGPGDPTPRSAEPRRPGMVARGAKAGSSSTDASELPDGIDRSRVKVSAASSSSPGSAWMRARWSRYSGPSTAVVVELVAENFSLTLACSVRRVLVLAHERREAHDVGEHDGGEAAPRSLGHGTPCVPRDGHQAPAVAIAQRPVLDGDESPPGVGESKGFSAPNWEDMHAPRGRVSIKARAAVSRASEGSFRPGMCTSQSVPISFAGAFAAAWTTACTATRWAGAVIRSFACAVRGR
jgi:hypothetical protein